MPYYLYDIRQWRHLPLDFILIGYDGSEPIYFRNIKKGSSFVYQPIYAENDEGGQNVIAYKLDLSITCLQSNYEDLLPMLRQISDIKPDYVQLMFLNDKRLISYIPNIGCEMIDTVIGANNDNPALKVKQFNLNWNITQSEISPELNITLKGLFSTDIMTLNDPPIFKQMNWRTINWS